MARCVAYQEQRTNTFHLFLFVVKRFRENSRCKYRTASLRLEIEIPLWRHGFPSALDGWKYEGNCYWRVFLHLSLSLFVFCISSLYRFRTFSFHLSFHLDPSMSCFMPLLGVLPESISLARNTSHGYCEKNFVWAIYDHFTYIDLYEIAQCIFFLF